MILSKFELVGRAGPLTSKHGPDAARTYTPNSTGTIVNTSDILWHIQLQLKF